MVGGGGSKDRKPIYNTKSAKNAKIEIRQRVLDAIGATDASVFDAYGGAGELYRAVWSKAARYVGCDQNWFRDERTMFVADNRRVMRAIDLGQFNVFDLDAFGSPYEQLTILAARRPVAPGERLGLIITDGSALKLKNGQLPQALAQLCGMTDSAGQGAGLLRWRADLINRALAEVAERMGLTWRARWQAQGRAGAQMCYIGLVAEGRELAAAGPPPVSAAAPVPVSRPRSRGRAAGVAA